MPKLCIICHKEALPGRQYVRRGMAKYKGGAGQKITGRSPRRFRPNLQRIKINLSGTIKRRLVCTRCIKAGKIVKA